MNRCKNFTETNKKNCLLLWWKNIKALLSAKKKTDAKSTKEIFQAWTEPCGNSI